MIVLRVEPSTWKWNPQHGSGTNSYTIVVFSQNSPLVEICGLAMIFDGINNEVFFSFFCLTTEATFDSLMNVQFKGVYFLTQHLLPLINDGGSIVNYSTGLTRFALPGYAAYASMKGAIETFTKYLAKELGSRKITANVIAPGAIDNDFNKHAFANTAVTDFIAAQTALGRVGKSEDIGKVVAFLCSEAAGWVNAQRLEASGGMFL